MLIQKQIKGDNELYVYFNGKLIYKRWLKEGYGKVFDKQAYDKYSDYSITDFDLRETPDLIHVEATLKLLRAEDGGRKSGIKSGYRPDHIFEYQSNGQFKYSFSGDIQFKHIELIMPGETQDVLVRFLSKQPIDQYMNINRVWWLHEGLTKIGEATINKIEYPGNETLG